jgi:hypothetical protein
MPKTLEESFEDFINKRVEDIGEQYLLASEEFITTKKRLRLLSKNIRTLIPEEYTKTFYEMDSEIAKLENIISEIMFVSGFKEGVKLHNICNKTIDEP